MWAGQGLENETGRVGLGRCVKGLKGHENLILKMGENN